jgi:hypothetical protein
MGGYTNGDRILSDAAACCARCYNLPECWYWTFKTHNNACWSKSDANGERSASTGISGNNCGTKDSTDTVVSSKDGYLIRFDANTVEFVAKFSYAGITSFNAGAFTATGDYYLHNANRFWKFSDLHLLPGYSSYSRHADFDWRVGVDDFSAVAPAVVSTVAVGADFVVWDTADITDASGVHTYAMGIHDGTARLVNLDTAVGWELLPLSGTGFAGGWGSAWLYDGSLYFANNDGTTGLILVVVATIDLSDLTVEWVKVSDSAATTYNDGMNCMAAPDPFPIPDTTDLSPFDCSGEGSVALPVQVYSEDAGNTYDVSTLDFTSGAYTLLYKFPLDAGTFSQLNTPYTHTLYSYTVLIHCRYIQPTKQRCD